MELFTNRLVITKFKLDMAEDVSRNSMDDDVKRFVPDEVFETKEIAEEVLEFLISRYDSLDGPFVYPILLKENNTNIGYVELVKIQDENWEIGYHIAKKYTNNGYAKEALKAFLPFISEKMNLKEIYGICLIENIASRHVLESSGFEKVFVGRGLYHDEPSDIFKGVWRNK